MCVARIRPSSSAARLVGRRTRANLWLSGISNHRRTHDSPREIAEAVMRIGSDAVVSVVVSASSAYCVGRRICRNVNVFKSRNIGVRGGSSDGLRNSWSKL